MKKALIIDDEIDICMLLTGILQPLGIKAKYSTSLKDGINQLSGENYSLLFLDNNLPDGSGLEQLSSIIAQHPGLQIIMISAYDGDAERTKARQDGAIDFIGKPFTTRTVKEKLMKHFQDINC